MKTTVKVILMTIFVVLISSFSLSSCALLQHFCSHEWGGWLTTLEPTCQGIGMQERTCSKCGAIEQNDISEIDHDVKWIVTTEPNCEESGQRDLICQSCENTIDTEKINPKGHIQSNPVTVDPTCNNSGYIRTECTECYMEMSCEYFGEPTGEHTVGDWIVRQEPSCDNFGTKYRECSTCHNTVDTATIDKLVHTYKNDNCTSCGATHEKYFIATGENSYYCGIKANPEYTLPEKIVIPSILDGRVVDVIDSFENCTTLKEVEFGENVVRIGSYAFKDCENLTRINILDSVECIDEYAFAGCTSLAEITIPSSVEYIYDHTFESCTSLAEIYIPNSVIYIEEYAFAGCAGLNKIILHGNIKGIGSYAFSGCTGLAEITIPDSIESIGDHAFYNCKKLSNIVIEDIEDIVLGGVLVFHIYIESIGENVFLGTAYYENTDNWENGALYIGNYLFDVKPDVSGAFIIKDGVVTIADYAFHNCNKITKVTVPGSVFAISNYAFANCTSLTDITLNDGIKSIRYYAFDNCTSLASITLPSSLTFINGYAFNNCSNLAHINIPKSVNRIYEYAFSGCFKLSDVVFEDASDWYVHSYNGDSAIVITDLSDPVAAAKYLRDTYLEYVWGCVDN